MPSESFKGKRFGGGKKTRMPPSKEEETSWDSQLGKLLQTSPFAFASEQLERQYQHTQDFHVASRAQLFHCFILMLAVTSIAMHKNRDEPAIVSWLLGAVIAFTSAALLLMNYHPLLYTRVSDILSGTLRTTLALTQLLLRRPEGLGQTPLSFAVFLHDFCRASMAVAINIPAMGLPMHFGPLLITQLITTAIVMAGNTRLCLAQSVSPFMAANTDHLASYVTQPLGDVAMRAFPLPFDLERHDFGSCEAVMSTVQISLGHITILSFLWHEVVSRRRYVAAHGLDRGHPRRWPFSSSAHTLLLLEIPYVLLLGAGVFWQSYVAMLSNRV